MTDILIVPATVEPLTTAQAKLHLRSTSSAEDTLVASMISAARGHAERFMSKAIVLQSRRLVMDCFPACIEGAWGPLRAVQSIQYLDEAGDLQTLDSDVYRVDRDSSPWRITLADGQTWPTTYPGTGAVRVNYTAGYLIPFTADADTDVLTAPGHGYADTEVTRVQTIGGVLPTGLAAGTNYYARDAATDTLKLAATSGGSAIDVTAAGTVPNVLGIMPKEIEQALQLLIQYFEQRDATEKYRMAAEELLQPFRFWRA